MVTESIHQGMRGNLKEVVGEMHRTQNLGLCSLRLSGNSQVPPLEWGVSPWMVECCGAWGTLGLFDTFEDDEADFYVSTVQSIVAHYG